MKVQQPFGGSGVPVLARECPRCGKRVGHFNNGQHQLQQAKHKRPGGGWCRVLREAGTGLVIG